MRKSYQYRFLKDELFPEEPSREEYIKKLISGEFFKDKRIYQIDIHTLTGTKFYLKSSSEPMIIGSTGIYLLTLFGDSIIENKDADSCWPRFDKDSLKIITDTFDLPDEHQGYLIINIIYEDIN